jgi:hypothetical protein
LPVVAFFDQNEQPAARPEDTDALLLDQLRQFGGRALGAEKLAHLQQGHGLVAALAFAGLLAHGAQGHAELGGNAFEQDRYCFATFVQPHGRGGREA